MMIPINGDYPAVIVKAFFREGSPLCVHEAINNSGWVITEIATKRKVGTNYTATGYFQTSEQARQCELVIAPWFDNGQAESNKHAILEAIKRHLGNNPLDDHVPFVPPPNSSYMLYPNDCDDDDTSEEFGL